MLIRFGVMIVAWLAILSGVVGALIGGFAILVGALLDGQATAGQLSVAGVTGVALVIAGLIFAIIGIAQVIFGVGLWQFRGWAVKLGIALEVVTLLGSIGGLFTGAFTIPSLISVIFSSAILLYLLSPHVRKHIAQRTSQARVALSGETTPQRP